MIWMCISRPNTNTQLAYSISLNKSPNHYKPWCLPSLLTLGVHLWVHSSKHSQDRPCRPITQSTFHAMLHPGARLCNFCIPYPRRCTTDGGVLKLSAICQCECWNICRSWVLFASVVSSWASVFVVKNHLYLLAFFLSIFRISLSSNLKKGG